MYRFDRARRTHPATARASARAASRPMERLETRVLFAAGDLDTTFSGDGKLAVPDVDFGRGAHDAYVYSDGKVLTVGTQSLAGRDDIVVTRYNANGSLDTSFSGDGRATVDFGTTEFATGLAVGTDGKIVVSANVYGSNFSRTGALARLTPAGALDSSFSGDGKLTAGAGNSIADIAIAPGNKVVAAGGGPTGAAFTVMRFTASGSFDSSFSGDGKAAVDFGDDTIDAVRAVAVMPDGRVVAAGTAFGDASAGWNTDVAIARFRADGSLDPTFSVDGKVVTNSSAAGVPSGDEANDVAVAADGKIVVAGGELFTAARYNADGSLDRSFGGDGFATMPLPGDRGIANAVALAPGGKVLVGGVHFVGEYYDSPLGNLAVARYNANGTPDTTFSADGWAVTDFHGKEDQARVVAAAPGGKVVAVGSTQAGITGTDAVARFNDNGSLDSSFSGDGKVVGPVAGVTRDVYATAVQSDNKILVAGSIATGTGSDFFLARYNPSGSLDTSFSGDGVATADFAGRYDVALDLLVQPDGKIVLGGFSSADTSRSEWSMRGDFAVARFNASGSLDTGFSGDGRLTSDFGGDERVESLARQANGGIIAAGAAGVARYTPAGSLDTTFAGDGKADASATAVATQGDKIILAGFFRVARLNANGTTDSTFAITTFSDGYDGEDDTDEVHLTDVAVGPGGSIYASALYHEDHSNREFGAIIRLNPNGGLDASFAGGLVRVDLPELYDEGAVSVSVRPDGSAVVAGSGESEESGERRLYTARYTAAGRPDAGYGNGGRAITSFGFTTDAALAPDGDVVVSTNNPNGAVSDPNNDGGYGLLRFDGTGDASGIVRDGGTLIVRGNLTADTISVSGSGGTVTVTMNGAARSFTSVTRVEVYGRDGSDTVTIGAGLPQPDPNSSTATVYVDGGAGNDRLVGSGGSELLRGGPGDDYLDGGRGADELFGDDGKDTVDYSSRTAGVSNAGEAGEGDRIYSAEIFYGGSGDDHIGPFAAVYGGAGNDVLTGGFGPNALWGEAGDDTLVNGDESSSGAGDYFRGGSGTDTIDYSESGGPVTVDLDGVADDGRADRNERDTVGTDVENIIGSGYDDTLTGNAGANAILGNGGRDTIVGGGGTDVLLGGWDTDRVNGVAEDDSRGLIGIERGKIYIVGGAGNDTISASRSGATLTLVVNGVTRTLRFVRPGEISVESGAGNDRATATGFASVTMLGGTGNDTLVGGAGTDFFFGEEGNDQLTGNGGNDTLTGGDGDDALSGGDGNDFFTGGLGADTYTGGTGSDTASYALHPNSISVTIGSGDRDDGFAGERDDVQGDVENVHGSEYADRLVGNAGNNGLSGGSGNDTLVGNAGDDTLSGGWGNDLMDGGLGSDWHFGGQDFDTVTYAGRTENLTIDIEWDHFDDGAPGERDKIDDTNEEIIGGSGSDRMTGGSEANTFRGGGGNDTLAGNGGDDLLVGDAGDDILTGGGGRDRLYGRDGSDTLFARGDNAIDFLDGGTGTDKAQKDDDDAAIAVEQFLA